MTWVLIKLCYQDYVYFIWHAGNCLFSVYIILELVIPCFLFSNYVILELSVPCLPYRICLRRGLIMELFFGQILLTIVSIFAMVFYFFLCQLQLESYFFYDPFVVFSFFLSRELKTLMKQFHQFKDIMKQKCVSPEQKESNNSRHYLENRRKECHPELFWAGLRMS